MYSKKKTWDGCIVEIIIIRVLAFAINSLPQNSIFNYFKSMYCLPNIACDVWRDVTKNNLTQNFTFDHHQNF